MRFVFEALWGKKKKIPNLDGISFAFGCGWAVLRRAYGDQSMAA